LKSDLKVKSTQKKEDFLDFKSKHFIYISRLNSFVTRGSLIINSIIVRLVKRRGYLSDALKPSERCSIRKCYHPSARAIRKYYHPSAALLEILPSERKKYYNTVTL